MFCHNSEINANKIVKWVYNKEQTQFHFCVKMLYLLNLYRIPEDIAELDLVVEKPSRQDVHFMGVGGHHILWHVMESLRLANNDKDNLESLYSTMCLLLVELLTDETQLDFASFILNLQVSIYCYLCLCEVDVFSSK